jgi:hypothetical protein
LAQHADTGDFGITLGMRPAEDGVRYHARDMAVVRGHIAEYKFG